MSQDKTGCYFKINEEDQVRIDQEDLERVSKHSWHIVKQLKSKKKQILTNIKVDGVSKKISLGQFLMSPPEGKYVYPRRSAREFDFTKSNLIVCTMKERQIMLPKRKGNCSSQYKGVAWDKSHKSWRAHVDVNGKTKVIGYFNHEVDAAVAYNDRVRDLYGDIAYQNRIDEKLLQRSEDDEKGKVAA